VAFSISNAEILAVNGHFVARVDNFLTTRAGGNLFFFFHDEFFNNLTAVGWVTIFQAMA